MFPAQQQDQRWPSNSGQRIRTAAAAWASLSGEAVEEAVSRDDTRYSLGSVLNHVLLRRQSSARKVIKRLELIDADWPDGGSAHRLAGRRADGCFHHFAIHDTQAAALLSDPWPESDGQRWSRYLGWEPRMRPSLHKQLAVGRING